MYVEENTIKRLNPPNEINWLKNLIKTGTIIIGFSHLFLIFYSIIEIIFLYKSGGHIAILIAHIGSMIYSYILLIGMLTLTIGFIGTSRLVQGSKIPLLIGAMTFIFIMFINIIDVILYTIVTVTFTDMVFYYVYISYSYITLKMILVILVQFVVTFTKSKLAEGESTINLKAISAYVLPVWIPVIGISLILTLLHIGALSRLFYFIGIICLSINQIVYAIEFSIKLSR